MSRAFSHGPLDFKSLSPALKALLLANAVGFVLAQLVGGQFRDLFGLSPVHLWQDRWVWQPLTYLFLHANLVHLLFNLLALWMFAVPVEAQWGSGELLKYYFLCGAGAGLLSAAITPGSPVPLVGASGAIYGLLVAFAMLYPDAVVYLYFFFPIKARDMAVLFGVIEFLAGASNATPGVARFAHLGGMVIGYLYIRWWWVVKIRAKALLRREPAAAAPGRPGRARSQEAPEPDPMTELDRILDKISAQGQASLSREELDFLRRHAQRRVEDTDA